jgi:DMSO/TMAO reductase YedYZ molybdopterin-dependent catalytic subunit
MLARRGIWFCAVLCTAAVVLLSSSGCLLSQERETPPDNLSLNRTNPGQWKGRLPEPSNINLGRTNSIKGVQQIDPETYSLSIFGEVERPKTMTFRDILEYPYLVRENVMYCVEGWSWSADWRGIAVRDLLAEAVPKPEGRRVIFYAADGYTSSFPIEEVNASDTYFLAYLANGEYLPAKEGYPLRLVAEGKWGYKWVKWVTKIEVTANEDHLGYWESRGYSDEADVR